MPRHRQQVLQALDALGDPHRRAIVELLRRGPLPVHAIADRLPISRPAVSRHLRLLKSAGLVTDQARATERLYRLEPDGARAIRTYVERVWGEAARRFALYASNTAKRK